MNLTQDFDRHRNLDAFVEKLINNTPELFRKVFQINLLFTEQKERTELYQKIKNAIIDVAQEYNNTGGINVYYFPTEIKHPAILSVQLGWAQLSKFPYNIHKSKNTSKDQPYVFNLTKAGTQMAKDYILFQRDIYNANH